jgi:hypothetical protein
MPKKFSWLRMLEDMRLAEMVRASTRAEKRAHRERLKAEGKYDWRENEPREVRGSPANKQ